MLNGDIILGPQWQSNICQRHRWNEPPAVLISSELSEEPHRTILLGVYSPGGAGTGTSEQFMLPRYEQECLGHINYFSSAPINSISCAYVFEDEETQLCRGILLEYDNGGSQAVGQCRIGVNPSRKYVLPSEISARTRVWMDRDGYEIRGVQVDFTGYFGSSGRSPPDGWECQALEEVDRLLFWFTHECARLKLLMKES